MYIKSHVDIILPGRKVFSLLDYYLDFYQKPLNEMLSKYYRFIKCMAIYTFIGLH